MNYLLFPWGSPEHLAMVAIGLDGQHHPYLRHGKLYYKPWRNRFTTPRGGFIHEDWENLKAAGLADSLIRKGYDGRKLETFWLTCAGLDWIGERLGITILCMDR